MQATDLQKHVTFCPAGSNDIVQTGSQGEIATVQYLVDNLNPRTIGDYHILVNYNLPLRDPGQVGDLEIDVVVISRFGVFLLEVKTWRGVIEAYDGYWLQRPSFRHDDVFSIIQHKAKVLHSNLFGMGGQLRHLGRVSVTGLVVLVRGTENFINHSHNNGSLVVGLDYRLIKGVSSKDLLRRGQSSSLLADQDIERVRRTLYKSHKAKSVRLVRNYRILAELSPGEIFEAFEAVNVHAKFQRVRVKRYLLPDIFQQPKRLIKKFKRNARAVAVLGKHPNILQTHDFFQDDNRPDIFYEITELPTGARLDEVMAQCEKPLSLSTQLGYVMALCEGLRYVHKHAIYHRNLSPQTVFISDREVQLADFNFAKLVGEGTISVLGEPLVDSIFTAPELYDNSAAASPASDVYSLGVLWYCLASLPETRQRVDLRQIDELALPESARSLMKGMLAQVVRIRPNIDYILTQLRERKDATKTSSEV